MVIEKSLNLKKQKMTKVSIKTSGLTQKLGKNFIYRHHVEPRSSIARADCSTDIDFIRSIYADPEIAQGNKCMTVWMSIRTEILSESWTEFHKNFVIEWNSFESV